MLNLFARCPLEMTMCLEMGLGCSFQFKYQVPVETPYVQLADINCCTCIKYLATFYHCLNSSFCQSIVYQDAHANLLTESTVTLNFLCNLIPVGKYCLYVNLLTSCPPCIRFICSFG